MRLSFHDLRSNEIAPSWEPGGRDALLGRDRVGGDCRRACRVGRTREENRGSLDALTGRDRDRSLVLDRRSSIDEVEDRRSRCCVSHHELLRGRIRPSCQ